MTSVITPTVTRRRITNTHNRLIEFPRNTALGAATPGVLSQVCDDRRWERVNTLLAGSALSEMWLDNETFVARFDNVGVVWVTASRDTLSDPVAFTSRCDGCGESTLCDHSVAAVLYSHGYTPPAD